MLQITGNLLPPTGYKGAAGKKGMEAGEEWLMEIFEALDSELEAGNRDCDSLPSAAA